MSIKMPLSTGGPVQAIKPLAGGVDGAPISITSTSAITTAGAAGEALYIMANVNCHIRFDGSDATTSDTPLPAYIPMVFAVTVGDKVSVIREAGDGLLYVHNVEAL